jgi:hypothetical protein
VVGLIAETLPRRTSASNTSRTAALVAESPRVQSSARPGHRTIGDIPHLAPESGSPISGYAPGAPSRRGVQACREAAPETTSPRRRAPNLRSGATDRALRPRTDCPDPRRVLQAPPAPTAARASDFARPSWNDREQPVGPPLPPNLARSATLSMGDAPSRTTEGRRRRTRTPNSTRDQALCGASWNRTSGLILISESAGVVTIDDPYLLLCGIERSHMSMKDVVTSAMTARVWEVTPG